MHGTILWVDLSNSSVGDIDPDLFDYLLDVSAAMLDLEATLPEQPSFKKARRLRGTSWAHRVSATAAHCSHPNCESFGLREQLLIELSAPGLTLSPCQTL